MKTMKSSQFGLLGLPKRLTDHGGERLIALCKKGGEITQESFFKSYELESLIRNELTLGMTGRLGQSNIHRVKHAMPHLCWSILPYCDMAITDWLSQPVEFSGVESPPGVRQSMPLPYMVLLDYIAQDCDVASISSADGTAAYDNILAMGATFGINNTRTLSQYALSWPYLLVALEKLVREIMNFDSLDNAAFDVTGEAYWAMCKVLMISSASSTSVIELCGMLSINAKQATLFLTRYRDIMGFSPEMFRFKEQGKLHNGNKPKELGNPQREGVPEPVASLSLARNSFYAFLTEFLINHLRCYSVVDLDKMLRSQDKLLAGLIKPDPLKILIIFKHDNAPLNSDTDAAQEPEEKPILTPAQASYQEWLAATLCDYLMFESGLIVKPEPLGITASTHRVRIAVMQFLKNYCDRNQDMLAGDMTIAAERMSAVMEQCKEPASKLLFHYQSILDVLEAYRAEHNKAEQDLNPINDIMFDRLISCNHMLTRDLLHREEDTKSSLRACIQDIQEAIAKLDSKALCGELTELVEKAIELMDADLAVESIHNITKIAACWGKHYVVSKDQGAIKAKALTERMNELSALCEQIAATACLPEEQQNESCVIEPVAPQDINLLAENQALKEELAAAQEQHIRLSGIITEKQTELAKVRLLHKRSNAKLHAAPKHIASGLTSILGETDCLAQRLVATLPKTDMCSVMKLASDFSMGRLTFTDSAFRSAEDYRRQEYSPSDLMSALIKLSDLYMEALKQGGDSSAKQVFGNAYAAGESDITMNTERLRRMREFSIDGKKQLVTQHLSINNYLRLYFCIQGDKVVIPYLGKHLEVSSSN